MDIKNTKEMMVLGLQLAMIGKQAMADGKISAADLGLIIQIMPTLGPAFEDIKLIPEELKDLDSSEAKELLAEAIKFMPHITDDAHLAAIVIKSIEVALAIGALVIEISAESKEPVVTSDGSDQANNG